MIPTTRITKRLGALRDLISGCAGVALLCLLVVLRHHLED